MDKQYACGVVSQVFREKSPLYRCCACGRISDSADLICAWCGVEWAWEPATEVAAKPKTAGPKPCESVRVARPVRVSCGAGADALLGGGYPVGASMLLGGRPGCGKSTLSIALCAAFRQAGRSALYVSQEMPEGLVAEIIERTQPGLRGVDIWEGPSLDALARYVQQKAPALIIFDSLQRGGGRASEALPWLLQACRSRSSLVAIGHASKTEDIAGEVGLQHDVDIVGELSRDEEGAILRIAKNRFGPAPVTGRI